jgi:hypothetical protein
MKCPVCGYELKNRTSQQNKSLHLFFAWIANMYNEVGHTYENPLGIQTIWTAAMVKELIWRPLQISLFNVQSTTKLDSKQLILIADTIIDYYAEQGFNIEFPNMQSFLNKMEHKGLLI